MNELICKHRWTDHHKVIQAECCREKHNSLWASHKLPSATHLFIWHISINKDRQLCKASQVLSGFHKTVWAERCDAVGLVLSFKLHYTPRQDLCFHMLVSRWNLRTDNTGVIWVFLDVMVIEWNGYRKKPLFFGDLSLLPFTRYLKYLGNFFYHCYLLLAVEMLILFFAQRADLAMFVYGICRPLQVLILAIADACIDLSLCLFQLRRSGCASRVQPVQGGARLPAEKKEICCCCSEEDP